jgi:hypothetical protein
MTELKDLFGPLVGRWEGQSTLYLDPDQDGDTQPSTVEVTPAANGKALLVNYVWHVDDAPERGTMLVERDPKQPGCRAAWVDSWHQNQVMMVLTGSIPDAVDMYGKYQAEGWPEWGWRIRLEANEGRFRLLMWNITPEGQEGRAVVGEYTRAAVQDGG